MMRFTNQKSAVLILMITTLLLSSCKEKVETVEEIVIENPNTKLKEALTFYASFDSSVDADFALGDARMYTVPNRQARDSAQVGLLKPDIKRVDSLGKFGAGLVFTERSHGYIYYPSEKNIVYNTEN